MSEDPIAQAAAEEIRNALGISSPAKMQREAADAVVARIRPMILADVVKQIDKYGKEHGYVGRDSQNYVPLRGLANNILGTVGLALGPEPVEYELIPCCDHCMCEGADRYGHDDYCSHEGCPQYLAD